MRPTQFEERTGRWIRKALKRDGIKSFTIRSQGFVTGDGGDYTIESLVRFTVFGGAQMTVLAECKHQGHPVERDELLTLYAKLLDVGAHKGVLFSTAGFQSDAVSFAKAKGIATCTVADRIYNYHTKRAFAN
jgi:restriction system protein